MLDASTLAPPKFETAALGSPMLETSALRAPMLETSVLEAPMSCVFASAVTVLLSEQSARCGERYQKREHYTSPRPTDRLCRHT